jgi:hypothetical protein
MRKSRKEKKREEKKAFPNFSKDNPASKSWKEILEKFNHGSRKTIFGEIQGGSDGKRR